MSGGVHLPREPEATRRSAASAPQVVMPAVASTGLAMQRLAGNHATAALLQRKIGWQPGAAQLYQQSREGMTKELRSEFYYVDVDAIDKLIDEVEGKGGKPWTPFQAVSGIRNFLRANYAPPAIHVVLDGTAITPEEAKWYFLADFKTFAEVLVDKHEVFKFVNTPDDNHAEDNMMAALDKVIEERRWHKEFSDHTLLMRINNSPCKRCARRLYDWRYRDLFNEFEIQFANTYERETGFTKATTKLRSGGVVMSLMSVTEDLLPLISKEAAISAKLVAERALKDKRETANWNVWLGQQ